MIKAKPEKTKSISAQMKGLKNEIDLLNGANQHLQDEVKDLTEANAHLKEANNNQKSDISTLRECNTELLATIRELRSENKSLSSEIQKNAIAADNFTHAFNMINCLLAFAKARTTEKTEPRELEVLQHVYDNIGRP